ncbi:MAG TPA: elongation factor P maturation arginine rhamnosyltransferase EarP [Castellaniella sp.]|uniref:elongation factor P maturation arginine rhamnosyltransferase EarP n=1 Tax=Castellaniella sp. TaxID=1955812 RepID=UPI002F07CEEF
MAPTAFDIFCRVVDNYGDAGVCWRLARQLAARGHVVRLWIDDMRTLARLVPALSPNEGIQQTDAVRVLPWELAATTQPPSAGVVVEAFACVLPESYQAAMAGQDCLWINLEYLSAETWVEGCHGLPSLQANGVPKYFFFPGFTQKTGGLLREPDLLAHRLQAQAQSRRERLENLTGQRWADLPHDARCLLLFSYPTAPFEGLQQALAQDSLPNWVLIPGPTPEALYDTGALKVRSIPFVPQARFDELLWCCDLNFVRGEDSLVRSLWAGAPGIWQIYPQDDGAHLAKLEAWMACMRWSPEVCAVQRAWNGDDNDEMARALAPTLHTSQWTSWEKQSQTAMKALATQADLVSQLLDFCVHHQQKS